MGLGCAAEALLAPMRSDRGRVQCTAGGWPGLGPWLPAAAPESLIISVDSLTVTLTAAVTLTVTASAESRVGVSEGLMSESTA